ncbi:MAG TPA: hypothetical protein ENJ90_08095, partial [Devosia sp.]|nr:hypothetical protein [Devosia sp.]
MFSYVAGALERLRAPLKAVFFSLALAVFPQPGLAQESVDVSVQDMEGFGRVVLTFNLRLDLP